MLLVSVIVLFRSLRLQTDAAQQAYLLSACGREQSGNA